MLKKGSPVWSQHPGTMLDQVNCFGTFLFGDNQDAPWIKTWLQKTFLHLNIIADQFCAWSEYTMILLFAKDFKRLDASFILIYTNSEPFGKDIVRIPSLLHMDECYFHSKEIHQVNCAVSFVERVRRNYILWSLCILLKAPDGSAADCCNTTEIWGRTSQKTLVFLKVMEP